MDRRVQVSKARGVVLFILPADCLVVTVSAIFFLSGSFLGPLVFFLSVFGTWTSGQLATESRRDSHSCALDCDCGCYANSAKMGQ